MEAKNNNTKKFINKVNEYINFLDAKKSKPKEKKHDLVEWKLAKWYCNQRNKQYYG